MILSVKEGVADIERRVAEFGKIFPGSNVDLLDFAQDALVDIPWLINALHNKHSEVDYLTREALAGLEHDQWAHWMKYMFSCGKFNGDGSWVMPLEKVVRWMNQANTPFDSLTWMEQISDYEWADKAISIVENQKMLAEHDEERDSHG